MDHSGRGSHVGTVSREAAASGSAHSGKTTPLDRWLKQACVGDCRWVPCYRVPLGDQKGLQAVHSNLTLPRA